MENTEFILARASRIADGTEILPSEPQSGPDAAARFLAPYRRSACEAFQTDITKIVGILSITTAQIQYLCLAGIPDRAIALAQWFLHLLHHTEEHIGAADFRRIKISFRESFSHFFCRYARALRDTGQIEEMRTAMRTALDLTQELPGAVVSAVYLYLPLLNARSLEGEPPRTWFLKRCAECLAALDFGGMSGTALRTCLDEFQFLIRSGGQSDAALQKIADDNPDDEAVKTLAALYKTIPMTEEHV